jgi:hypothetical protein
MTSQIGSGLRISGRTENAVARSRLNAAQLKRESRHTFLFKANHKLEAPKSPLAFMTEWTIHDGWLQLVGEASGQKAHFPFQVHAHMLRHATSSTLFGVANAFQGFLA